MQKLPRLLIGSLVVTMFVAVASGAPLRTLSGHVQPQAARLPAVGRVDVSQRLNLAIGLPLRNQAQLTQALNQIYDPASPNWHHYLSVEQFTEQFGPTTNDYELVADFARKSGFTITGRPSNRMILQVNATVGQIEAAFHLRLNQYQHPTENRIFFAPDTEPSVDAALPILHISGLDNYRLPRPG
ncbi:MAG TPA: protease pro-enzyme activation domain-containing protein, partial [Dongiaceae bacterium]|nr:protease pro-enzyme activation domain-containing protein [Dongiaceae bacterium]